MDFENRISSLESEIHNLNTRLMGLKGGLKSAKSFTQELLNKCGEVGYTKISIGRKHKSIPDTMTFPFGVGGSVFAFGEIRKNGWPAIWGIVDKLGIGGGCGNSHQKQIDDSNLIAGVYHLKKGKWEKVA